MEEVEPKPAQNTPTTSNQTPTPNPDPNPLPNPNPSNESQTSTMPPPPHPPPPPPPQPPQTADSVPPQSKKRPHDSTNFQTENSNYFKMRAILKDIRPHFIEVLRTPDFRNCPAAHEISEQMKLLMDLYKQMMAETVSKGKCNNVTEGQPILGENQDPQKLQEESKNVKLTEQPLTDRVIAKPPEEKPSPLLNLSENQQVEDVRKEGSYVVGGSAFGWNFVTFPSKKAVYYGVTKESFRSQSNS